MTFDEFLREACPPLNLEWRKYRRRAARHGVRDRLEELGLEGYPDYLERLRNNPVEAAGLADRMRITVSRFFREHECWETLAGSVLPELLGNLCAGEPFRAWSAGCSSGEEPYTLAILWQEHFREQQPDRSLDLLASDIDAAGLERARAGIYRRSSLREVAEPLRQHWFHPVDDRWRLAPEIRAMVRFEKHHLLQDPPPPGRHLVCCRYLAFTYYRGDRLLAAAARLREALLPGGVLMLGRKESAGPAAELFERLPGTASFYRRKS